MSCRIVLAKNQVLQVDVYLWSLLTFSSDKVASDHLWKQKGSFDVDVAILVNFVNMYAMIIIIIVIIITYE